MGKMVTHLWICFFIILTFYQIAASFDCYSCTYTRSANSSVNYECVSEVTSLGKVGCSTPNVCKTVASFEHNLTSVRSVTRNCLPKGDNCNEISCCNMAGTFPLCEEKCEQSLCNNINAEAWLSENAKVKMTTKHPETSQQTPKIITKDSSNLGVKLPASLFDVGEDPKRKALHKSMYYEITIIVGMFVILALCGRRE